MNKNKYDFKYFLYFLFLDYFARVFKELTLERDFEIYNKLFIHKVQSIINK